MKELFFGILGIIFIFLPLAFWMYLFVNFYSFGLKRAHFFMGIFFGMCATIPFVIPSISDFYFFHFLFEKLNFSEVGGAFLFLISLQFILGILGVFFLILNKVYLFQKKENIFKFLIFFFCINILYVFILYLFNFVSSFFPLSGVIFESQGIIYVGHIAIVIYYSFIAYLEENMKYLSTLAFRIPESQNGFWLYYASTALGFAFFENILYTYFFWGEYGLNDNLLKMIFLRGIFSLSLHIFASLIFAYGIYIYKKNIYITKKRILFLLGMLAVFLSYITHMSYDIFLHFSLSFFLPFYIIFLYFFIIFLSDSGEETEEHTPLLGSSI